MHVVEMHICAKPTSVVGKGITFDKAIIDKTTIVLGS